MLAMRLGCGAVTCSLYGRAWCLDVPLAELCVLLRGFSQIESLPAAAATVRVL